MEVASLKIKKGYKQTEVGVIPDNWEEKKLGDIGEIQMCRRVFNHETKTIGSIPFFKIGTFGGTPDAYISEDLYNSYRKKFSFPKKGDVLISAAGTIGRTVVYDGKPSYFQDSNIVWIENNERLVSNNYLYYVLKVAKYNTEGGTIQRLYNSIIKGAPFACPPKIEQEEIATTLSDTDSLIQSLDALIEKKKNIKTATMQQLLTGKTRLAGFSGEWNISPLGDMVDFFHGRGLPKSDMSDSGLKKCIHYGQLFTEYSEQIHDVKSRTDIIDGIFLSKKNDVLVPTSDVTPRGLATASCIKEDGVILGGGILVMRPKIDIDGSFVSYFITNNKNAVLKLVKGSTVFHLYAGDLSKLELKIPPSKDEQVAIVGVLEDMRLEISSLEKRRDKLIALKQGMMHELLTGNTRLI